VVGNIIKCKLEKSRFTREKSMVETKLSFTKGLDRHHGLADLAIEAGIWKSQGGRIEVSDGRKIFGKNIANNPSEFFTEDILKQLDTYCKKKYNYGGEVEESDVEEEEALNED
jgi:hypothetical protein